MPEFVRITDLNVSYGQHAVLKDLSWTISPGENYILGGKSGSGKTTLVKAISGGLAGISGIKLAYKECYSPAAKTIYIPNWYQFTNLEGDRNFYYQQRYNRHQEHDTLTVKAELIAFAHKENLSFSAIEDKIKAFGFEDQLHSQLIELSSGENKKLQLLKGLWQKPELLIIDEPYTGLDKDSRIILNQFLDELVENGGQLILICNENNLPKIINRFAHIVEGKLETVSGFDELIQDSIRERKELPSFLRQNPKDQNQRIAKLKDITIRYGQKEVLKEVSWEVKNGEKWLLTGPNGSGKSTLLSIINGDHPQSYGLDIELFEKKRGSGESIWDIKKKIGMVSAELHWYFDQNATVWHTLASGFYDSIGWFIDVKFNEKKQIEELMEYFDLSEHKNQLLHSLPLGKQRLTLLARSMIKNPPLLILDEPCQGLDSSQAKYFNQVVDELSQHGKTLIYVGHYESQLPKCIENRIVLNKGQVIALEHKVENVL